MEYDPLRLARVARSLDLRLVVLHGSRAEGRQEQDSDADLAVLAAGPVDSARQMRLLRRLAAVFPSAPLDVSLLNGAQPNFLAVVAETGVPLYESQPGEFLRFRSLAQRQWADAAKWQQAQLEHLRGSEAEPEEGQR